MENQFLLSVIRQFLMLLLAVTIFITVITHDLFSEQKKIRQPNTNSQHIGILIEQPIYPSGARKSQARKEVDASPKALRSGGMKEASKTEDVKKNHAVTQTTHEEERSIIENTDKPNILIVTYMRSGSTFLADIIQQVPGTFYVYEPFRYYMSRSLQQYYYRKHAICSMHNDTCRLPTKNTETALRAIHDIKRFYSCKFAELPNTFLRKKEKSAAINSLKTCSARNYGKAFYQRKCIEQAIDKCLVGPRLIKTIRLSMGVASVLLRRVPNLKIIHLLRDPRGLVHSRSKYYFYSKKPNRTDISNALCDQLLRDIELSLALQKEFPGQLKMVLYENLAEHPHEISMDLFSFLGISPSSSFKDWLLNHTHGNENSDGYFGTSRSNSTETANHWRERFSVEFAKIIDHACPKVYKYMGLKAITDEETLRNMDVSLRYHTNLFD